MRRFLFPKLNVKHPGRGRFQTAPYNHQGAIRVKLVQFIEPGDGMRLGLVIDDEVLDLTGADQGPRTLHQLYYDGGDEIGLVAAAQNLQQQATRRLSLDALLANRSTRDPYLTKPVSGPPGHPHALRVWLAGVTHEVSAKLREIEAQQATGEAINVYDQEIPRSVRRWAARTVRQGRAGRRRRTRPAHHPPQPTPSA